MEAIANEVVELRNVVDGIATFLSEDGKNQSATSRHVVTDEQDAPQFWRSGLQWLEAKMNRHVFCYSESDAEVLPCTIVSTDGHPQAYAHPGRTGVQNAHGEWQQLRGFQGNRF